MTRILLIDDDEVEHRLIRHMLRDTMQGPYVLRYAPTVDKALSILKTDDFDVILLDDKLGPGQNATKSVPEIRRITESVPMVLISSVIDADHLRSKTILDVYDIVDKFQLRQRIREGLFELDET
jgi:DNA-binding NtrC family response regulator